MKKFITILIITLFGFKSNAQNEIVYGNVRYDGFQNITKGAFWASRPEAKMVYNGGYPPNAEVIVLEKDYYVRFIEHNNLDRNYIIFPKGERIYTKNGNYYAAICGNQIEYIRPVDVVKIVEVEAKKPDPVIVRIKDSTIIRIKDSVVTRPALTPQYQPQNLQTGLPKAQKQPDPEQEPEKKEKKGVKLTLALFFNGNGNGGGYNPYVQQTGFVMPPVRLPNDGNGNGGIRTTRNPNDGNGNGH